MRGEVRRGKITLEPINQPEEITLTQTQKLTIRASEIRSKLLAFSKQPDLSTDDKAAITKLETQLGDTETQLRAAIKAEGTETRSDGGEVEAIQRLSDRANVGAIFQAAVEKRSTDGAEAEIQAHFKIPAHSIPLAMLEERAVATVPADASHTPGETNQGAILQPVFSTGDGAFLGVSQPRVAPGQTSYPVLTSRPAVRGPSPATTPQRRQPEPSRLNCSNRTESRRAFRTGGRMRPSFP